MKLDQYVRTLWQHTAKGVRRGEPANRIFVVVQAAAVNDGSPNWANQQWLHAWKCQLTPQGMLMHPAFDTPMAVTDSRIFDVCSANGSQPTAVFRPDSLYKLWTP